MLMPANTLMNQPAISSALPDAVIKALRTVIGAGKANLHEPSFNGNEWVYLKECLDSTFVSSVGSYVDRFEKDLATFTGARHAVAVVNGTAALHLALLLAGVKEGDEVLLPSLTFIATANAVAYCKAVPHFIDCNEHTLGVDPAALRDYLQRSCEVRDGHCFNKSSGRIVRALVPMHTFGHPVDIDGLLAVAADYQLALVEDAAESLGSYRAGRHTGTHGLLGVLSFNGNKTITTGGGGAILTNDAALAKLAKHLSTTAKIPHAWEYSHDVVGYNYRMPNLNAALGCAQLEQLPDLLANKRRLFEKYRSAFADVAGVQLFHEPADCHSNYWLQTLVLDEKFAAQRDAILQATNAAGLMTRPVWTLAHQQLPFRDCPSMPLPVAQSLAQRLINIPSSAFLGAVGAA